jgi:(p)ppGpp synthase/HD superfamily hydrolase
VSEPTRPPFVDELPTTREAYDYARTLHAGQRRGSDAAPFILHPLEVGVLLRNRGYDDEVVAAGLLHDLVEDTDATLGDIRERFGDRVADLVAVLSDDASIEAYEERKAALRAQVAAADECAQAIYAADKVAKCRELRAELTRKPAALGEEKVQRRLRHYEASAEMLEARLPGMALQRQLRFELWALRTLPPR